ncbi:VapC toxin family PIN domain ribonuclease [filamentous cyanobacterium CCT1]|nr:VapC toxin family PIN domain ribonuclease [filamentous cyanobacterium CCT1]PSN79857.1 VapC toxin family PIN domain ribonuclease [filamentous cyanobacterium CCP4]
MVIDTSAIVAILFAEPERETFNEKIAAATTRLISAPSWLECNLVIEARKQALGRAEFELFVHEADLTVVEFDRLQADLAATAWRTYGKGRHPAGLNFGDCFAYALAKSRNEPLLFKGNDFSQTDIAQA